MLIGLALLLTGVVIVRTGRVAVAIGYLGGLSGLAFIVAGRLIGTRGFTSADTLPTNLAYTSLFASMIWLLVVALRRTERSASVAEISAVVGQVP